MTIYFHTPGTLEFAALTTMGLHAKPNSDNPIGYFGTGLKFAIATLVRNGAQVIIQTAGKTCVAAKETRQFRGEPFEAVVLVEVLPGGDYGEMIDLNITDKLGKNWKLWMAYRELYSNTLDERGTITTELPAEFSAIDQTLITVVSDEFDEVHAKRAEFIIDQAEIPVFRGSQFEIYNRPSQAIFYKGIKVYELDKPAQFTYNLIVQKPLTEDRTLAEHYWLLPNLAETLLSTKPEEAFVTRQILTAPKDSWESGLQWYNGRAKNILEKPDHATFLQILESLKDSIVLAQGARRLYSEICFLRQKEQKATLDDYDNQVLAEALDFCEKVGWAITFPVEVRETLGQNILGLADTDDQKILISKIAFEQGKAIVIGTLLEEYWHLRFNYEDCTREFQNFLINNLVRQYGKNKGISL